MRNAALIFGLSILSTQAFAQTFSACEASAHVGETVTIRGTVDEVHTSGKNNTFLDLCGVYPKQAFTGVIFSEDAATFPNAHSLDGKIVDISGPVKLYRGKPEIILRSGDQLKVE